MLELLNNIRFVLVNTTQPGNIGGAARAMKNMGLSQLCLVQPEVFPSDRAVWRAAGASELLESAVVVDSLEGAIADCHLVFGTSARERRIQWPLENPQSAAARALHTIQGTPDSAKEGNPTTVAFVFGREHSGLTNEELQRCHAHVHIPSNPQYSSLNLSAAVQVLAYELRMVALGEKETDYSNLEWDERLATGDEMEHFFNHLEQIMLESGFLNPDNPKQTLTRMRRLFNRVQPDELEISILRGLMKGIEQKWKRAEDG